MSQDIYEVPNQSHCIVDLTIKSETMEGLSFYLEPLLVRQNSFLMETDVLDRYHNYNIIHLFDICTAVNTEQLLGVIESVVWLGKAMLDSVHLALLFNLTATKMRI